MKNILIFCVISALLGISLYIMQKNIPFRLKKYDVALTKSVVATPTHAQIWFFKDNRWQQEKIKMVQHADTQINAHALVQQWLNVCWQEKVFTKRVQVQNTLLDSTGTLLYISFDRSPFDVQESTHHALYCFEGLLKTLHTNTIPVQRVQLLVHHEIINDNRLNLGFAWPITGFLKTQ